MDLIRSHLQHQGLAAQESSDIIRKVAESHFIQKDIYNNRHRLSIESLRGLTPTQRWIAIMMEQNVQHAVLYNESDPDRILSVVWTYD
jgi:hypothetical protein